MKSIKTHPRFLTGLIYLSLSILIGLVFLIVINIMMYVKTKPQIHPISSYTSSSPQKEFAIVLGASVHGTRLSHALQDRVNAAIFLYKKGLVKKILMSGDGIENNYNEPNAMRKFAIKHGVPSHVIYIDTHGFNTYDSIVRAKMQFHIKDAYIVSQGFHVGRAVWIAQQVKVNTDGVTVGEFKPMSYNTFREAFARFKDFWLAIN